MFITLNSNNHNALSTLGLPTAPLHRCRDAKVGSVCELGSGPGVQDLGPWIASVEVEKTEDP